MYQRGDLLQVDESEQEPIHALDQAIKSLDRDGRPQFPRMPIQSVLTAASLETKPDPRLIEQLRSMVAQEARQKCKKRFCEATYRAAENVFSDFFIIGTTVIRKWMRNAGFIYVETILTAMAHMILLDEIFGRSIDRWTQ